MRPLPNKALRRKGRTATYNYYLVHQHISNPNRAIKIHYIKALKQ